MKKIREMEVSGTYKTISEIYDEMTEEQKLVLVETIGEGVELDNWYEDGWVEITKEY